MLTFTSQFCLHTKCSEFPKKAHEKGINTEEWRYEAREAQEHEKYKACEAPGHEGHETCEPREVEGYEAHEAREHEGHASLEAQQHKARNLADCDLYVTSHALISHLICFKVQFFLPTFWSNNLALH